MPGAPIGGDAAEGAPVLSCGSRMVDATANRYATLADYFEAEQASDVKHEWFNGAVYARSRGTPEHARLTLGIMAGRARLTFPCLTT